MRSAVDVIQAASQAGLRLVASGDAIIARGVPRRLTDELRAAIEAHADELLMLLAAQQVLPGLASTLPANDQAPARRAASRVSTIVRPSRYNSIPSFGMDRVCCWCAVRRGPNGPLPYSWDAHFYEGKLLSTCSPWCRAECGFAERKLAIDTAHHPVRET